MTLVCRSVNFTMLHDIMKTHVNLTRDFIQVAATAKGLLVRNDQTHWLGKGCYTAIMLLLCSKEMVANAWTSAAYRLSVLRALMVLV